MTCPAIRRRACATLAVWSVMGFGLAACGIPTGEDSFSEIPNEDIPFGLDETSTSTSTTTTTMPVIPVTTIIPTTTIAVEQVDVYFLSCDRLQPVPYTLPIGYSAGQVVDVLENGPPPGAGLDTLIEPGLIVSTDVAEGVITVDLDPEIFEGIATFDQAEAIGQIVLTLTENVSRVGSVLFTLDGEPTQVKKGDSLLTEPDEAVTFDDYAVLLTTSPPATTSTTTTTTLPPDTTDSGETPAPGSSPDQPPATSPGG